MKKRQSRTGSSATSIALPEGLRELLDVRVCAGAKGKEEDVIVFDWATIAKPEQDTFLGDLFGDCAKGDFADLIDIGDSRIAWKSQACIPFALAGVVGGPDTFTGGSHQFHRLLLLDGAGQTFAIDVDGTALPAKAPKALKKTWDKLGLKPRPAAAAAGELPTIKPTKHMKLVGSLGSFQAVTRQTPLVRRISVSADGRRALVVYDNVDKPAAQLFDVATGASLRTFPDAGSAILSPDGAFVYSARVVVSPTFQIAKHAICYRADDGNQVWDQAVHGSGSYNGLTMAVSPDGKTLVTCSDEKDQLRAWSAVDCTEKWTASLGSKDVYAEAIAFSPDGELLATGSSNNALKVWNATKGTLRQSIAHGAPPRGICWLPDGRVVSSSSHLTAIWKVGQDKPAVTLGEYERGRHAGDIAYGKPGYIAGRVDPTTFDIWDIEGKLVERTKLKGKTGIWSLATTGDDLLVGTAGGCALRFRITR